MHTWQAHRHRRRLLSGFRSATLHLGVCNLESGLQTPKFFSLQFGVSRSRSTSQHDDACAVSLSCDRVNVNNCQPVGRGPVVKSVAYIRVVCQVDVIKISLLRLLTFGQQGLVRLVRRWPRFVLTDMKVRDIHARLFLLLLASLMPMLTVHEFGLASELRFGWD